MADSLDAQRNAAATNAANTVQNWVEDAATDYGVALPNSVVQQITDLISQEAGKVFDAGVAAAKEANNG